jgi:uncharacterized membrane protein YebE (DUF533 family)
MSFMRTLATVAAGFAAAKGLEKYQQMGGMAGLQKMMQQGSGGLPGAVGMDDLRRMADQMGLGRMMGAMGGADMARDAGSPMDALQSMFGGGQGAAAGAGLGGLMAAMQGAAQAGGQGLDDMMKGFMGDTPASQMAEDNAKLMLRAIIQAAKADGEIDAAEKQQILDALGGDVDPEERAFVERELNAPVDIDGLARDTSAAMRAQVYATSLTAITVDHHAEAAYLNQLAQALGLSQAERAQVHAAMGVPT